MKLIHTILSILILSSSVFAQDDKFDALINEGIVLHDNGDYRGALKKYATALKISSKSTQVHYEMASTYLSMGDYNKAIKHSGIVIKAKDFYSVQGYIIMGTSYDLSGNPKKAVSTYQKGLKTYKDDYLLYYNLGMTSYQNNDLKTAEESCQSALKINPNHSSSHFILGALNYDKGYRIESLLALYNFLLLEPASTRSPVGLDLLFAQVNQGATQTGENTTTISLSMDGSEEFHSVELLLSLTHASNAAKESEGKTEAELFAINAAYFFTMLGEFKGENSSFYWNFYGDFFYDLSKEGHCEALAYYVTQLTEDQDIGNWLDDNEDKLDDLGEWFQKAERTY
jgi:tetratricopeptide (TPR) repeat protein